MRTARRLPKPWTLLVTALGMALMFCPSAAWGQSGSRGSGTRMMPRPSYGVPSRTGAARSSVVPNTARPTGMLNSAAAAARSRTAPRSYGSGTRSTTGIPSTVPSYGRSSQGYSSGPTTGLVAPGRASRSNSSTPRRGSSPAPTNTLTIPEGFRRWTDSTGKYSIQGKLAAKRDNVVWIRRLDGKLARLNLSQLSTVDQAFVSKP